MKLFHKWWFIFIFFLVTFIGFPALVNAQINPGCDPSDPACPIDGGLSALLAIGVAYGIKKYKDTKKHPEAPDDSIVE